MVNCACAFSQSESGKYFESIVMINLGREGSGRGGAYKRRGLINFLPLKRRAYLRGVGINRGFTVFCFYHGLFNCV